MITQNNEIKMFKDTLSGLGLVEYIEDDEILNWLVKGLEIFGSNAAHAKDYENLTNNKLKCYSLLIWAMSCDTNNKQIWLLLNQLKQNFSNDDWKELVRTTDNVTAKIEYSKNILEQKNSENF